MIIMMIIIIIIMYLLFIFIYLFIYMSAEQPGLPGTKRAQAQEYD